MWQNFGGVQSTEPATYANGRQNCWEARIFRTRKTTDVALDTVFNFRPRFKRRLDADEGLFLFMELHPNSLEANLINPWCRTLVTDTTR